MFFISSLLINNYHYNKKPIIDRERLSNQYSSLEYLLAKLSSEMPMDAAVAAAFGLVLHWKSNLRQDMNKFVSVLALLGTVSSSLGLAIGAMCPTGYYDFCYHVYHY